MIWDMFRSGRWTTPILDGEPVLEKPPLLYWTSLAVCSLLGRIDAGLLRLPAALYGWLGLLLIVDWGRRLGRERAGWIAAFLCATTLLYAEYSRIVLTDICLTFMVMVSLHAFWIAYSASRWKIRLYAAFLLVTALSFYAKGLLGPGLVIGSAASFLVLRREWRLALLLSLSFLPVLAAVVLPWAAALNREGGHDFLIGVFIDNQVGRFFSLERGESITSLPLIGRFLGGIADRPIPVDPYFVHKESILYYLVHLPVYWLPWAFLVPPALVHWFKRRNAPASSFASFVRCAFVTIVVVLHASSTKEACYALPLFPLLFVMVGVWSDDALAEHARPLSRVCCWITFALVRSILLLVPVGCALLFAVPGAVWTRIADQIRSAGITAAPLGTMTTWVSAPGPATAPIGFLLSTAALVVAILARRRARAKIREGVDRGGVLLGLATALVIESMACLSAVMPVWDHQRTFRPVGELVRNEIAAGRRVALAIPDRNVIGAMIVYADTRLPVVSLVPGAQHFLMEGDRPRGVLIRVEDADAFSRSPANTEFGMRAVPDGAGYLSKSFRLITRD